MKSNMILKTAHYNLKLLYLIILLNLIITFKYYFKHLAI